MGPLALSGNIHMSMFDIHAACENEDDQEEDYENSINKSPPDQVKQLSRCDFIIYL
jgi:hypothetical protein